MARIEDGKERKGPIKLSQDEGSDVFVSHSVVPPTEAVKGFTELVWVGSLLL